MKKDIYVVASSKGGVGKSTTTQQFIAPLLYEVINAGNKGEPRKVTIYEVDALNDSSKSLTNTKIFNSVLIKSAEKDFEKVINNELCNLKRDYPIVIDIGNGFFYETLETLSGLFINTKIHFIVPTLADELDFSNTINTIETIKKHFDDPNIILALSRADANFKEVDDLKDEFNWIFGTLINLQTGKNNDSIFKLTGIKEKYFTLKNTKKIDTCRALWKISIYETLEINLKEREKELINLFNECENKEIKPEIFTKKQTEYKIKNFELTHLRRIQKDAQHYIKDNFRNFEMLL